MLELESRTRVAGEGRAFHAEGNAKAPKGKDLRVWESQGAERGRSWQEVSRMWRVCVQLWEATEGFLAWGWQAGRSAFPRENGSGHVEGGLEGGGRAQLGGCCPGTG